MLFLPSFEVCRVCWSRSMRSNMQGVVFRYSPVANMPCQKLIQKSTQLVLTPVRPWPLC